MFDIRIICDPGDGDDILHTLAAAFRTGTARSYPTRDGMRRRLYLTADHHPDNPDRASDTSPTT
ncbi:hypothetical protein [Streptomyces sp. NPDC094437]|uniref:hypothetical protein n=1 Tax=Streptomyces sp. NPDC094437 TaxID=3366060 RepID=UPI0037FECDD6